MSAPKRIWWNGAPLPHSYTSTVHFSGGTEYRRTDLPPTDAEVMAHPKVKALVEALREAIKVADRLNSGGTRYSGLEFARTTLAAIQEAKP